MDHITSLKNGLSSTSRAKLDSAKRVGRRAAEWAWTKTKRSVQRTIIYFDIQDTEDKRSKFWTFLHQIGLPKSYTDRNLSNLKLEHRRRSIDQQRRARMISIFGSIFELEDRTSDRDLKELRKNLEALVEQSVERRWSYERYLSYGQENVR